MVAINANGWEQRLCPLAMEWALGSCWLWPGPPSSPVLPSSPAVVPPPLTPPSWPQVQAVSCSASYQTSALRPDEAARLQAVMGLTLQEVCAAKWVFTLLDLDNDGEGALGRRRGGEGGRVCVCGGGGGGHGTQPQQGM